mmetsp:Transcript_13682/g.17193  ORF Transcript_13682/g.17193 Transcript_13682/m.17193 type:complete len:124 (-) Transcript_13682:40-411(-)
MKWYNNVSGEFLGGESSLPHSWDLIGDLDNLSRLKLNDNVLCDMPPSLGKMVKLEILELRNNPLESLVPIGNAIFFSLTRLWVLKLDCNRITNLLDTTFRSQKLVELNEPFRISKIGYHAKIF